MLQTLRQKGNDVMLIRKQQLLQMAQVLIKWGGSLQHGRYAVNKACAELGLRSDSGCCLHILEVIQGSPFLQDLSWHILRQLATRHNLQLAVAVWRWQKAPRGNPLRLAPSESCSARGHAAW